MSMNDGYIVLETVDFSEARKKRKHSKDYYATEEDIERYKTRSIPTMRVDRYGITRIGKTIRGLKL